MKYNIKADYFQLPLAIKQILFLNRIEKKLEEKEKSDYAKILEENTREYLKLEREWR